jgi:hypothetical protein
MNEHSTDCICCDFGHLPYIFFQVAKVTSKPGTGIMKLAWRSTNILVATLEGLVRVIDPRSGNVLADCSGHLAPILDFALSR